MQTTDQRPAIALCLLLSMFAMYAGFVCIRIAAGHDVRPDLAVWAILASLVLLGASAARNASLRARASRAREEGGLGASAYGRLDIDPAGAGQAVHRAIDARRWNSPDCAGHAQPMRRAGEATPDTWTSEGRDAALQANDRQLILSAIRVASGLSYNDENQAPAKHLLRELAHRFGAAIGFDGRATPAEVSEAELLAIAAAGPGAEVYAGDEGDDEASIVTPACNGDELLCEMMQELDDMLGDAVDDPDGIAPESWRTIGRVWRDICIAHGIDQPTYMHRDPDHWDATPEHDYDDAIEAAGPAMHEAAGG